MGARYNILLFMIVLLMVLVGFFVSAHLMFGDKIPVSASFLLRESGAPWLCTERALSCLPFACTCNGFDYVCVCDCFASLLGVLFECLTCISHGVEDSHRVSSMLLPSLTRPLTRSLSSPSSFPLSL